MAQYCEIAKVTTNCTDNCYECLRRKTKTREIEVGDKVRYIAENDFLAKELGFCPPKGTIGVVVRIDDDAVTYLVRWPEGTTDGDGCWYVEKKNIELV